MSAPTHTGPGHETRDIDPGTVVRAGIGIALMTVVAMGLMYALLRHYVTRESEGSAVRSPLAGAYGRRVPPAPRLQADPRLDLAELRAREDGQLTRYGWVDRDAGVAQIPIERAMELLAERGLPAREETP